MTTRHPLLTPDELADLAEIDRLLDEANSHAYSNGDCGKSSEGHISVDLGTHFDRDPDEPRRVPRVSIYAYMLGPHRSHDFDSIRQALDVVKVWHHNEMLSTEEGDEDESQMIDEPYYTIEAKRRKDCAALMEAMWG